VQDVSLIDEGKTAAKRQWVGLTEEEIAKLDCYDHLKFARAIEAKLRSKNNG
jgi:hypothetical protein